MKYSEKATLASSLNIIAGIWLFISPFILGFSGMAAATNAMIVGAVIAILAIIRVFTPTVTGRLSWLNFVLGIWLVLSPLFVMSAGMMAIWNSSIVGIVVAILAIWSAQSASMSLRHGM